MSEYQTNPDIKTKGVRLDEEHIPEDARMFVTATSGEQRYAMTFRWEPTEQGRRALVLADVQPPLTDATDDSFHVRGALIKIDQLFELVNTASNTARAFMPRVIEADIERISVDA